MAFPNNNTLLDDTTRADENPMAGPSAQGYSWAGPVQSGQSDRLRIATNKAVVQASPVSNAHAYCTATFNQDQESQVTLSVVPSSGHFVVCGARVQNPGLGTLNAYYGGYSANGSWFVGRIINADAPTTLTSQSGTILANGDKIGFQVSGGATPTLSLYSFHGAVWKLETTNTPSGPDIYSGDGYLWWEIDQNASEVQMTNFTGGASATATSGVFFLARN